MLALHVSMQCWIAIWGRPMWACRAAHFVCVGSMLSYRPSSIVCYMMFHDVPWYSKALWRPWRYQFYFIWYSEIFHALSQYLDAPEGTCSIVFYTSCMRCSMLFQGIVTCLNFLYEIPPNSMLFQSIWRPWGYPFQSFCQFDFPDIPCYSNALWHPWVGPVLLFVIWYSGCSMLFQSMLTPLRAPFLFYMIFHLVSLLRMWG